MGMNGSAMVIHVDAMVSRSHRMAMPWQSQWAAMSMVWHGNAMHAW